MTRRSLTFSVLAAAQLVWPLHSLAQTQPSPKSADMIWRFDDQGKATVHDSAGNIDDPITGNSARVAGVTGQALQFDGYTTRVVRAAAQAPALGKAFSLSAWVQLNTYPWNHVPIVDQSVDDQLGYALEVDAFGHAKFSFSANGTWRVLLSDKPVELKRWSRIVATLDPKAGASLYIDGRRVAAADGGVFDPASEQDVLIGRVRAPQLPYPSWLIHPHDEIVYSLDGALDDVEVLGHALGAKDVAVDYASVHVSQAPSPYIPLPAGNAASGGFGAFYTTLKWDPVWDRLRRYGPDSDVVVRFPQSSMRLVFWQGTNFVPAWVTSNGRWFTDQFVESWAYPGCPEGGDCEPMSDKHGTFAKVTILESSPARVVIRWRYALPESRYNKLSNTDPETGWSDWAEEYWYVYPDGVAIRKQTLWSTAITPKEGAPHEWQESIVINGPGQRPEDNINPDALTLENMAGDTHTYSWAPKSDDRFDYPKGPSDLNLPAGANIQLVNLKAPEKPFEVVFPANVHFNSYNGEKSYSMFEWWNHWPVAQIDSSGRPAVAADRPSHSSLSHIYWDYADRTELMATKLLMTGLTSLPPEGLLPIARSWTSPAPATLIGQTGLITYDSSQRAYVVTGTDPAKPLTIHFAPTADSPLYDPAIVIAASAPEVSVTMSGHAGDAPSAIKTGLIKGLEGTKLVVFMSIRGDDAKDVTIAPAVGGAE